jgi:hypothetical protein
LVAERSNRTAFRLLIFTPNFYFDHEPNRSDRSQPAQVCRNFNSFEAVPILL